MADNESEKSAVVNGGTRPAETYTPADVMAPIIVSLGKKKQKVIKRLKRGKGGAMDEVMDVIDQVQENLGAEAEGKIIVPVIIVYRKKERRFRGWW